MHLHTTQSHQDRNMEEEHYGTTCMQFTSSHHSKAAAPDMISINSLVITACRVRLKVRVSLPIISPTKPQTITYKQLRVTNQRNRKNKGPLTFKPMNTKLCEYSELFLRASIAKSNQFKRVVNSSFSFAACCNWWLMIRKTWRQECPISTVSHKETCSSWAFVVSLEEWNPYLDIIQEPSEVGMQH